jgi:hypothetical protein
LHIGRQLADLRLAQLAGKTGHLGGGTALADGVADFGGFQPLQAFRQQGRAHAAQPVGTVAALAMLAV